METILMIVVPSFIGVLIYLWYLGNKRIEREKQELLVIQKKYNDEAESLQELYMKNGVPSIEPDILLKKGEVLFAKFSGTWNELRRHTTNIRYSGFSTRIPIMKGLSYRSGSYDVDRQTADIQISIDRGDMYITNKAIFFRGQLGNKTLQYDKISNVIVGLDGFTLERESGKSIFFACNRPQPKQLVALQLTWQNTRG